MAPCGQHGPGHLRVYQRVMLVIISLSSDPALRVAGPDNEASRPARPELDMPPKVASISLDMPVPPTGTAGAGAVCWSNPLQQGIPGALLTCHATQPTASLLQQASPAGKRKSNLPEDDDNLGKGGAVGRALGPAAPHQIHVRLETLE